MTTLRGFEANDAVPDLAARTEELLGETRARLNMITGLSATATAILSQVMLGKNQKLKLKLTL